MTHVEMCPNGGRTVSRMRVRGAIYTEARGWISRCPRCGRVASFVMAEVRPDGLGYRRRWVAHETSTKEVAR